MRRRTPLASAIGVLAAGVVDRAAPGRRAGNVELILEYDRAVDVWLTRAAMAALGARIHILGGDVQSAIVPLPAGLNFTTAGHEAFEATT